MAVYFPASLPLVLQGGYSENRTPNILRTTFMSGEVKQRLLTTFAPFSSSVTWLFTDKQYGTFLEFYNTKLNQGTEWFMLKMLYNYKGTAAVRDRQVRIKNGAVKASLICFNGKQIWKVTCDLDVKDDTV